MPLVGFQKGVYGTWAHVFWMRRVWATSGHVCNLSLALCGMWPQRKHQNKSKNLRLTLRGPGRGEESLPSESLDPRDRERERPERESPAFRIPTVGIPLFGIPTFGILGEFRYPLIRSAKLTRSSLKGLSNRALLLIKMGVLQAVFSS